MQIQIDWDSWREQETTCNRNIAMLFSLWVGGPVLLLCLVAFPKFFPAYAFLMEKPPLPMLLMFGAYGLHFYLLFRHMQKDKGLDVHGKHLKQEG